MSQDVDGELTADLVGDYLFTDPDFVNRLSTENRSLFQKLFDEIKYLCRIATAGSKEARQLEKVKHTFEQAYRANSQALGNLEGDEVQWAITAASGEQVVWANESTFTNKQLNDHKAIAAYIADHIGEVYTIIESGQKVYIGEDLPGEYTQSGYTSYLLKNKPAVLKAKNKATPYLGELVETATNRRWEKTKHTGNKDATYGMYRYDSIFAFPVRNANGNITDVRAYDVELLIRNASDGKKYLYDIVGIKKNTAVQVDLLSREARLAAHKAAAGSGVSGNSISEQGQNVKQQFSIAPTAADIADVEYADAVKRGDAKIVRKLVDDAARRAGYTVRAYHGTQAEFTVFDGGAFFTDDYMNADGYASGENVVDAYLKMENPLVIDAKGQKWDGLDSEWGSSTREIVYRADNGTFDGVIFENINDSFTDDADLDGTETVYYPFNNTQIKSAELVTYDEAGNVIPLSKRFNQQNQDIRYSMGSDTAPVSTGWGISGADVKLAPLPQDVQQQAPGATQGTENGSPRQPGGADTPS